MANSYYENQTSLQNQPTEEEPRRNLAQTPPPSEIQETPQTAPDTPDSTTLENAPAENTFPDNSTGNLRIGVTTLNQLSPISGATVTVSSESADGESTSIDSSSTDSSGNTKTFTLPSPSASFSQEPTALLPFAIYTVSVSHPDYYDFKAENVQVFGGITTQLPVVLIPLPELPNGERTKVVVIPKQNL